MTKQTWEVFNILSFIAGSPNTTFLQCSSVLWRANGALKEGSLLLEPPPPFSPLPYIVRSFGCIIRASIGQRKKDCEHNELKPGDSSVNDVSETSLLLSLFSHSVVSDSLCPHRLQHAGPPCPSPTPGAYSDSCPFVGDATQPSHPLSSPSPPAFNLSQHQGLFKWVSSLHQVAKYWSFSFSISPSNEYSGLISFRMDWLDLLAV